MVLFLASFTLAGDELVEANPFSFSLSLSGPTEQKQKLRADGAKASTTDEAKVAEETKTAEEAAKMPPLAEQDDSYVPRPECNPLTGFLVHYFYYMRKF